MTEFRDGLDPVRFLRERLGLEPDPRQVELLTAGVRRGMLNCSRQWGKSTITAAMAVHRAYCEEDSLCVVLSPTARQSGEFLRKAAAFVRRLGIRARGDGDNEISLLFPNGSRIVGLPGTEATVRGFSRVSLMLIDEAARVSDELYLAMRPILAIGGGDLWVMSTPFGQRGFFWDEWTNHPERWRRLTVKATECPRISEAFLAEEQAVMGDRWFRQEYMCEFVDVDDSVFSRDSIERALRQDVEPLVFR